MFPQQIPLSYFSFCQSSSKQHVLTIIPEKLLIKTTLFCLLLSAITHTHTRMHRPPHTHMQIPHHSLLRRLAQSLFDSGCVYCTAHQFKCRNYIYKVFVSSIFHTFCNVCLLMCGTVIAVLLHSDCSKPFFPLLLYSNEADNSQFQQWRALCICFNMGSS